MRRVDHVLSAGQDLDPHMDNWRKDMHGRRTKGKPQLKNVREKKKGNKLNSRVT